MNEKYIVTASQDGLYGHWGSGATVDEALAKLRKAARRRPKKANVRVCRFTSDLPFAPPDREARVSEADAWVGRDGSVNWVRCEREWIEATR